MTQKQIVGSQEGIKHGYVGVLRSHSLCIFDKWILSLTEVKIFSKFYLNFLVCF